MTTVNPLLAIIIANLFISAISLVGIFTIAFTMLRKKETTNFLVSLAAGVLLATAFLDIIPEALENSEAFPILLLTMIGMIISFLMERFLLWYHHHHEESHNLHPTALLVLFGDSVHNFIDGLAIAASFMVNPALGVTTTIAVAAHEIPQELANYGVLINSGMTRGKALLYNFISALTAVAGGVIGYYTFQESTALVPMALALTGGIFIYVATADLIPELHTAQGKKHWFSQTMVFLLGIMLIYAIIVSLPEAH